MAGTPEQVQTVELVKVEHGRTIYRVTLTCGCAWWEHYDADIAAPTIGRPGTCYADHAYAPVGPRRKSNGWPF